MIYTRKIGNLQNFEIFRNCNICEMFRTFQNKIFGIVQINEFLDL